MEEFEKHYFETQEDKEKEALEQMEKIELDGDKKLDLALFILGKKEAVQLGDYDVIESKKHKEDLQKEFQSEFDVIKKVLDKFKLSYDTKGINEDRGILGFSFLATRDNESLQKIKEAVEKGDDKTFGLMMGYPETAVNTYNTKEALNIEKDLSKEEQKYLEDNNLEPFLGFMPSKAHWKEEIGHVEQRQALIKEKSHELFRQIIEDYKKRTESES